MRKFLLAFLLLLAPFAWSDEPHKIVFLISPPRSLSVGFMRMIEARGDFKLFHEPSIKPYHQLMGYQFSADWFDEGAYLTFDEVKDAIFKEAATSNVFVKEMCFSLLPFLEEDLIQRPNVHFIFLFRNPHHNVISLYKKVSAIVDDFATIGDFEVVAGYEVAYQLYQKILEKGGRQPLILFSEDLASNPQETVAKFCDYVQIPFDENCFSWQNLGREFHGAQEWHEKKKPNHTQHWHGDAIQSTHFTPLTTYEVDSNGNPTFSEVTKPIDRDRCIKTYLHHLPYYLYFKQLKPEFP